MEIDPAPNVKHHESHHCLVGTAGQGPVLLSTDSDLDAIIVPSARPASFLDDAANLALEADTWLVILSSRSSKTEDVRKLLARKSLRKAVAVEIPADCKHPLMEFSSSFDDAAAGANRSRNSDLSCKRNLGLIIARLLGWGKILFLDDDIRGLKAVDLAYVSKLLDRNSCVAFSMNCFPDNSVVSHARRLGFGSHQEIFVSGSAMAVSCRADPGFFPDIYNEDLFFAFDDIERGATLHAGSLNQLPYYPFDDPSRAASEEFGEVLMEGLLTLLHERLSLPDATEAYWRQFLPIREAHIVSTMRGVQRSGRGTDHRTAMRSLQAAQDRLSEISPSLCKAYLTKWRRDLVTWKARLRELPTQLTMSAALESLNLMSLQETGTTRSFSLGMCSNLSSAAQAVRSVSSLADDRSDSDRIGVSRPSDAPHAQVGSVAPYQGPSDAGSFLSTVPPQAVTIRTIAEDDWSLLRDVRLQALQESPRAFASNYTAEASYSERQWRAATKDGMQWFVALKGTKPIGVVATSSEAAGRSEERHVESMWVAPGCRGLGIARRLLAAVIDLARAQGVRTIMLWVLDGNDVARSAYLRLGFTFTGERQPLPSSEDRIEERMKRELS